MILEGDCLDRMREMEAESVDAVVTDPPYGLSKEPDIAEVLTHWLAGDDYIHKGRGFMGKTWDSFVPGPAVWREVYRVLKPGGHLLCFSGTRTQDLMGISLRLAGFEIRDVVQWIYSQGFPKSLSVDKAIDKLAGAEREAVGPATRHGGGNSQIMKGDYNPPQTAPATDEARKWAGYGSALKPAHEPIALCRKPLSESSIARNVLNHGTGAINVAASRVGSETIKTVGPGKGGRKFARKYDHNGENLPNTTLSEHSGRFPANLILSHSPECRRIGEKRVKASGNVIRNAPGLKMSYGRGQIGNGYADPDGKETVENWECSEECPVRILDEQSGQGRAGKPSKTGTAFSKSGLFSIKNESPIKYEETEVSGASRFFKTFEPDTGAGFLYKSKASKRDRSSNGAVENHHPTVKSVSLMAYLVRMVSPPGGTVLDPFAGSGSTLVAAVQEGFDCIGIEAEPEYAELARRRLVHAESGAASQDSLWRDSRDREDS